MLAISLTLGVVPKLNIGEVFAENAEGVGSSVENTEGSADINPNDYIYFDLAAENVTIGATSYSGAIYIGGIKTPVTGTHLPENKYYIYQSTGENQANTGYVTSEDEANKKCTVPSYPRVSYGGKSWSEYITNNTSVTAVSNAWETAAVDSGRKPLGAQAKNTAAASGNRIIFENASNYEADVTIDNIWTYYQTYGNNRNTGGITAHLKNNSGTKLYIRLKGDNRFGNIHYGALQNRKNQIIFSNGDSESAPGSLTVADFPEDLGKNHWASAIGGDDADCDKSDGIVINSGIIYAGTTAADNCTALGGGGNEYGRVTINDGIVTAVAATTGTAIGGGIGWGGAGGNTDVTINKGEVYAYNFGIDNSSSDKFKHFVPAVAIGGGSSQNSDGNASTTVNINGGFVYAQCMGGAAIGGGGSASGKGGSATINITGGTIIAKSTGGTFKGTEDNETVNITPGVSIGGGTGKTSGGSVTLNIDEVKPDTPTILRTGSIGGGSATGKDDHGNPYKAGNAKVTVSGGNIIGQVIMAGGAANPCSFTMTDGTIHDTDVIEGNEVEAKYHDPQPLVPISYIRENGGAVFMNDPGGTATISGGEIKNCHAKNGGAIYMAGGTCNLSKTGSLLTNSAKGNGGGIYVEEGKVNVSGGYIDENSAVMGGGMYVGAGEINILRGSYVEDVDGKQVSVETWGEICGNTAIGSGGGMYIGGGNVNISDGEIYSNTANIDGGGMYVGGGQVDLSGGEIHNNSAGGNGGGMCVYGIQNATGSTVVMSGGLLYENKTTKNGGGVYVGSGKIDIKGGSILNNIAIEDGGGAYIVGDVHLLSGEICYNEAKNGGGICVNDGTILMYGGRIDFNTATEAGGGIYVSDSAVNVTPNPEADAKLGYIDIFSGSISNNKSKTGGGVAVFSNADMPVRVTVGVNCEHPNLNTNTRAFDQFAYPSSPDDCGLAHTNHVHSHIDEVKTHLSCPEVKNNVASDNGGGFFLKSAETYLVFYCIHEAGNIADGKRECYALDVQGGKVVIGDSSYDHNNPDQHAKGNVLIESTVYVEGGVVDIYGTMENPLFNDQITVRINGQKDHFEDHRYSPGFYKVHYYENFKGDGDTPTGLYTEQQYPDKDHIGEGKERYNFTVESSYFIHPGYKIVGWNTQPDGKGIEFKVNETYNLSDLDKYGMPGSGADVVGTGDDEALLILYAIWERSGYVLIFDPNVPTGETYTGEMENQRVTMGLVDGSQKINPNQFQRLGYQFLGWALTSTGEPPVYADEYAIKADFTEEDGASVTLYAKWEKCNHAAEFLVYTADGNVLTQTCTCGGHTATATVTAVNCNYDGATHEAEQTVSGNWLYGNPTITYVMAADSVWDEKDNFDNDWAAALNPKPTHAGNYTAKIVVTTADGGTVFASTDYQISRVKWDSTGQPQIGFENITESGGNHTGTIVVTLPIVYDNALYRIERYNLETQQQENVAGFPDWQTSNQFPNVPFGYYYFFSAKLGEDRDHLDSDPSQSNAYLATGGNIVLIEADSGIQVDMASGDGYFTYTVYADRDYHFRGYQDNRDKAVSEAVRVEDGQPYGNANITIDYSLAEAGKHQYVVNFNEVTSCKITLKFQGVAKDASVSPKVTDGQVFRDFNDVSTVISCDSAFTVRFALSDFIPDEYSAPKVVFSHALPAGTTIIMKTGDKYWYCKIEADATKSEIPLTEFIEMGVASSLYRFDSAINTVQNPIYQFIVDFSQATGSLFDGEFTVTFRSDATAEGAPDIWKEGNLQIKAKAKFELTATVTGESATLTCTYTLSSGKASVWNGRETALVLSKKNNTTVPSDLTLTTVIGGSTTRYPMNKDYQFIIPLGKIETKNVAVTLNSNLFSSTAQTFDFTVSWYVAQSGADQAPLNNKVTTCPVTFTCQRDPVPSVRIDGEKRTCEVGGTLTIQVTHCGIPNGATVTAYLQRKVDGKYIDTAAKEPISTDAGTENQPQEVRFPMGTLDAGSYRILVIVRLGDVNILQVPYYFLIQ